MTKEVTPMRLSIKTCTLNMPFAAMLDFCVAQGVQAVEIGTGNWSGDRKSTRLNSSHSH